MNEPEGIHAVVIPQSAGRFALRICRGDVLLAHVNDLSIRDIEEACTDALAAIAPHMRMDEIPF
jgi:hypothetical protein